MNVANSLIRFGVRGVHNFAPLELTDVQERCTHAASRAFLKVNRLGNILAFAYFGYKIGTRNRTRGLLDAAVAAMVSMIGGYRLLTNDFPISEYAQGFIDILRRNLANERQRLEDTAEYVAGVEEIVNHQQRQIGAHGDTHGDITRKCNQLLRENEELRRAASGRK